MANNVKKNQGNGSFIFIWVLIVLLAVGTVGVLVNYRNNHSTIIESKELASALSVAFNKPEGKITTEDLDSVEEVIFNDIGTYGSIVNLFLDGYKEAYDAYNAEGITEEEKANLTNPSTLILQTQLTTSAPLINEIGLFKNLEGISALNQNGDVNSADLLAIAAEKYPNLREFVSYGYTIGDFSLVGKLTNLETLSVSGTPLTDISAIANLKNLKVLDLSNTGISDISVLSSLDNEKLEALYLDGNNITDWSAVSHIDQDKITTGAEEENAEETTEETTENSETAAE